LVNFFGALLVDDLNLVLPNPPLPPIAATNSSFSFLKSNISVLNTPGTIDSDYRGEIKIILFNHGKEDFVINNNDRIAQMILMPIIKAEFEEVENLPKTLRGSGGFGSTGK